MNLNTNPLASVSKEVFYAAVRLSPFKTTKRFAEAKGFNYHSFRSMLTKHCGKIDRPQPRGELTIRSLAEARKLVDKYAPRRDSEGR